MKSRERRNKFALGVGKTRNFGRCSRGALGGGAAEGGPAEGGWEKKGRFDLVSFCISVRPHGMVTLGGLRWWLVVKTEQWPLAPGHNQNRTGQGSQQRPFQTGHVEERAAKRRVGVSDSIPTETRKTSSCGWPTNIWSCGKRSSLEI